DIADLRTELKQDIADLRTELKQDIADVRQEIAELRTEFKADIAGLEVRIMNQFTVLQRWYMGSMITLVTIMIALMTYFNHR
ncbi:MAG: hypothetical protein ORO03_11490, partial [Alphaproteobacteria bacterium]|nr:hypothetical protein [Alphaproteobacteria bacterium]